jgi:hypothetical protein
MAEVQNMQANALGINYNEVFLQSSMMKFGSISSLVFDALAGGGVTKLYIDNAVGLFGPLGIATGVTVQQMDVKGAVTIANFQAFLQTYAFVINKINYSSDSPAQLDNAIFVRRANLDENQDSTKIDIAIDRTNMAFNDELQSIYSVPFVWDFLTGLTVATVATVTTTIAVGIAAAIPYGKLDDVLRVNPFRLLKECNC